MAGPKLLPDALPDERGSLGPTFNTEPQFNPKYSAIKPQVWAFDSGLEYPYDRYDSELEIPNGNNPGQNAWLTIHLWVKFNYADSTNQVPGVIYRKNDKYFAQDANKKEHLFPVLDWDDKSKADFELAFLKAEEHWNYQFQLTTPSDYDRLDYDSRDLNWIVRPNVLCLFRLHINRPRFQTEITVVRLDRDRGFISFLPSPSTFRSHSRLYADSDVGDVTVGHELGHAIGQSHILGLEWIYSEGTQGKDKCVIAPDHDTGDDDCYEDSKGDGSNWMGSGNKIHMFNAISWQKRIVNHCPGTRWLDWNSTTNTETPPRKIPAAITLVGPKPTQF
jgi:hypothetical protein